MTVDLTTEDISWELGPLLQTGVIHKVAELSVSKTARGISQQGSAHV